MKRYLNTVINSQKETIDELNSEDFDSLKSFKKELRRLKDEYVLAGGHGDLYWYSRKCKNWGDSE